MSREYSIEDIVAEALRDDARKIGWSLSCLVRYSDKRVLYRDPERLRCILGENFISLGHCADALVLRVSDALPETPTKQVVISIYHLGFYGDPGWTDLMEYTTNHGLRDRLEELLCSVRQPISILRLRGAHAHRPLSELLDVSEDMTEVLEWT